MAKIFRHYKSRVTKSYLGNAWAEYNQSADEPGYKHASGYVATMHGIAGFSTSIGRDGLGFTSVDIICDGIKHNVTVERFVGDRTAATRLVRNVVKQITEQEAPHVR